MGAALPLLRGFYMKWKKYTIETTTAAEDFKELKVSFSRGSRLRTI